MLNRFKYVMNNENGATALEIVVWISVIIILCTFLLVFGKWVMSFLDKGANHIGRKSEEVWRVGVVTS